MNICILATDYLPSYNGATIRVSGLAKALSSLKYKVVVIIPSNNNKFSRNILSGIIIYKIPCKKYFISGKLEIYTKFNFGRYLSYNKYIWDIIKNEKINIIHTRPQLDFCYLGMKIKKRLNLPLFMEMHRLSSIVDYEIGKINFLNFKFLFRLERYLLNKSDHLIVLSEIGKNEFLNHGVKSNIIVVPNASHMIAHKVKSANLPFPKKNRILLYAGTMRENEGVENLILAFDLLTKKVNNVNLILIGKGEKKSHIVELVKKLDLKKQILFLEDLTNDEIMRYFKSADLFVHPRKDISYHRNFIGLKFYDALAFGLPIITYDIGEAGNFVKSNKIGIVTLPNIQDFSNSVILLLKNKRMYKTMKLNSLKLNKKISWANSALILHNIYKIYLDK